jgi:CubicO group peptidase (beta-lactamase class C family)
VLGEAERELIRGIEQGWHTAGWVYCSTPQETFTLALDARRGHVEPGEHELLPWHCAGKPVIAMLTCVLAEQGVVDLNEPICRFIPEMAEGAKRRITLAHLLTHTSGLREANAIVWGMVSWDDMISHAARAPLVAEPGSTATYTATVGWSLVVAVLERATRQDIETLLHASIFEPAGMEATRLSVSEGTVASEELERSVTTVAGGVISSATAARYKRPGGQMWGPTRDLGRFYAWLRDVREGDSVAGRAARTLIAPRRVGIHDPHYGGDFVWGLGIIRDPRLFPRCCTRNTAGHDGLGATLGLLDMDRDVVVAMTFDRGRASMISAVRTRRMTAALYRELGVEQASSR